ncbi:MAG TPA: histone deacetylase [Phycisphaerae bacterium]|nr:histone deacetylase [Phycisphaerae bacterium]HRY66386.1 histone deacetylase [Phycisphaerae bacterium]HSA25907.1 histone deacetylase [Phycisphaerae bacterium]
MASTGIVWTEGFLRHDTGPHHPERPDRLTAIYERLRQTGLLKRSVIIEPPYVDLKLVERVHAREYVDRFRRHCEQGEHAIDTPDCPICPSSYDIARLAAGGCVAAVDRVMAGELRNAFCPVRPPGHHAEYRSAMGFCFLNNTAIAAEHLHAEHGVERVAILDWDVHHGNGTQHQFDADAGTLFISVHQHPYTLFPGTGFEWETGAADAVGLTLNIPMMPGTGDEEYREAFEEQILPKIAAFKPGFILVSTGFDAHEQDPLGQINLSTDAFGWMTRQVRALADSLCGGRLVTILEGGYDLASLADSTQAHVEGLMNHGAHPPGD